MSVLASPLVAAIANPIVTRLRKLRQPERTQPGRTSVVEPDAKSETGGKDGELGKTASQTPGLTVAGLLKQYAPQYVRKHSGQAACASAEHACQAGVVPDAGSGWPRLSL